MLGIFASFILCGGVSVFLFFRYFKKKEDLGLKNQTASLILKFERFYSSHLFYIFLIHLVFYLIVYFINKNILVYFIYANLLSFLFIILSVFIDVYLWEVCFAFKEVNYKLTDLFFKMVKYLIYLSFFMVVHSLYQKANYIDFAVMFAGVVFSVFLFSVVSQFSEIENHINIASCLLVVVSLFFLFFKYLDGQTLNFLGWVFSVYIISKMIGFVIEDRLLRSRNLRFQPWIIVNLIFLIPFFLKFYGNMYIYLAFVIVALYLYIVGNLKKDYSGLFVFLTYLVFKITSNYFSNFVVDFNKDSFLFFILSLFTPYFFEFVLDINFLNLVEDIKTQDYLKELRFKLPYVFLILILILFFTNVYEIMKNYYGYSDTMDLSVIMFSCVLFYIYEEFYKRFILKTDIVFLKIIHILSINLFIFSSVIVIVSVSSKINYTNLFSVYLSFAIISIFFAKNFLTYVVPVFYLSMFYLLLYV